MSNLEVDDTLKDTIVQIGKDIKYISQQMDNSELITRIDELEQQVALLKKSSTSNNDNWQITYSGTYSNSEKPTKELLTQKSWSALHKDIACYQGQSDNSGQAWLKVEFAQARDIKSIKLRALTGEIRGGWSASYLNNSKVQVLRNGIWVNCLTVSGHNDSEHKIITHAINQTNVTTIRITRSSYMAFSYLDFK